MSGVDSRVVTMKFDNGDFQAKVTTTLSYLQKLKESLKFPGADKNLSGVSTAAGRLKSALSFGAGSKSLEGVGKAAKGVQLAPIGTAADAVSGKFTAMSTAAVASIALITVTALRAGSSIVKNLSLAPVMDGFHEYETNMNSIQTVLANTQSEGTTLKDVNASLQELNTYSDKTIYNFSQMARNIGTFTAAGVKLDVSVGAIKGIANLAAVSGSNAEQASTAMYQLSQAIANNKVGLQDWNSVVNAGMGGKVFQEALFNTGKQLKTIKGVGMNTTFDQWTKSGHSFRNSLQDGWITGKVLTDTLQNFTGDLTAAQLKSKGYNDEQIKQIQAQGKMAQDAATKVKTMTQLVGTLKEAMGSGWTNTWQIVFGDFDEAKTLFTGISQSLGGMIANSAKARNATLTLWKSLGGRDALLQGIKNAFDALMIVINTVKGAFRDVFPAKTGAQLAQMSKNFRDFTEKLKMGGPTAENLKRTLRGLFSVFGIIFQVVKGVIGVVSALFGHMSKGSGGILKVTGNLGDFVYGIDQALKKGSGLNEFFTKLEKVLEKPIDLFKSLLGVVSAFFSGIHVGSADKMTDSLGKVTDKLYPLNNLLARSAAVWHLTGDAIKKAEHVLSPLVAAIGAALSNLGSGIAQATSGGGFSGVLDAINTGLFGAIVILIRRFLKNGISLNIGGGFLGSMSEMFDTLTGSMKAMQTQIKAKTLMLIAGAIALLTASLLVLSTINSEALTRALIGMTAAFAILLGGMAILTKVTKSAGMIKMPLMAASMILLGTALLILSAAVKVLASMSWEELAKGLGSIVVLLAAISLASGPLSANSKGMVTAGVGMMAIALAMIIMAQAVKQFATMSWGDIAKGLSGVAATLVVLAGAIRLMPKGMLATGIGLLALSVALNAMALAVLSFGSMNLGTIAKGLVAIGGALIVIAGAMHLMPKGMLLQAVALNAVGTALVVIAGAMALMGTGSWETIAKGLAALAGTMLILAVGLNAMTSTLAGSASLIVAAGALAILAPVLVTLGLMSWGMIAKGLVTLAAAFVVIGVAGLLLTPIIPSLIGLGVAIAAIGLGVGLAGAGILAFSAAFAALTATGAAGVVVMTAMLRSIIGLIPFTLEALAKGIVAFALVIAESAPKFVGAFVAMIVALLDGVIRIAPKIGQAIDAMLNLVLGVMVRNIPKLASAGLRLLIGILTAISTNIYRIVAVVATLIVRFLAALGSNAAKLADAGAKLLISFINGIAKAVRNNSAALREAGLNLALAIIDGMTGGLASGAGRVASAAKDVASNALHSALGFLGIHSPSRKFHEVGMWSSLGLAQGLTAYGGNVERASSGVAETALSTIKDTLSGVSNAISGDLDMTPRIAPVIDLSEFRKGAGKMASMLNVPTVVADVSYGQASSISADQRSAKDAADARDAEAQAMILQYTQNNYSPESLSAADIYRRTQSQLSQAKDALGLPQQKSA